ncbi:MULTISPECIES: zinc ribbon domain-containing protein [unclassified Okeania]|uniref:Transposase n=1 Tax=Okeania hirsuta TaxID=1458930 RepID=A0A3N6P656_9CYAN|nr:transposase [Okeania sp. SIO4D6]NEP42571.1 transposase [Okeania sp. SIO2H7]NEP73303.1 transposase [Okeania sp. SIO2G5]NEP90281.1 transposase [Okeania sp. SIO2C2]NEP91673.1 transposase [Okeania sp. SIO2F5]NEQ95010.1 transposase [Okeania sp. SIO2G4]NES75887.1 transposase [Okeania sp. SIO1H4]NES88038.1 transposase [Okeania sp. SIO2B9]NET14054.1 transposase [Okeania sp. SIO1H6]NET22199.1 transposase [Okeania sp. SIO1H5]NET75850.1 transposase [Okeania sp. SIO1F9]NET93447.1 transposase [Oke
MFRSFDCPECGISIDRDLNASINLKNAVRLTVNACV